ncbi:MAG: hypothetical protein WBO66_00330 [Candidatus Moraniibacteriota bacterium]
MKNFKIKKDDFNSESLLFFLKSSVLRERSFPSKGGQALLEGFAL